MVLVGKKASECGRVFLAHNNDLTGSEKSFIEKIPPSFDEGEKIINYSTGLSITLQARTYEILIQRIESGFEEGDAVAINEFGVAIAGGVALGRDRNETAKKNAPLIPNGLPGGIRYDMLARSKSARECVINLGNAYSKYGVSYPSGIGIADSNEIWYIECGGGKQWAAVRIPDSCYWVQANGYRIGDIDTSDTEFFLTSPQLLEYCSMNDLWNPEEGGFNFASVFGGGRTNENGGLSYDRLRVWRGINLITPSLNLKSENDELPIYLTPDEPLTEADLFALLRDFYEGTNYDRSNKDPLDESIRSIATWRGVHSSLIVLTPSEQIKGSTILWSGLGSSFVTGFAPIPFGVTKLPEFYKPNSEEFGFNMFSRLAKKSSTDWQLIKSIQKTFIENERNLIELTDKLIEGSKAQNFTEESVNSFSKIASESVLTRLSEWLRK